MAVSTKPAIHRTKGMKGDLFIRESLSCVDTVTFEVQLQDSSCKVFGFDTVGNATEYVVTACENAVPFTYLDFNTFRRVEQGHELV